ncbi:hypothetical protein K438DRAFT_1980958 [Mycena galopus ATCC 62051]|nr:hypothetical protein K438DRAFT_1980958 [Mycena galopus ATCC 62051]
MDHPSWALDNPIFPKAKMADVIAALPKYNKERLPLDKEGVYFTLSFGDLIDLLAVTPAVDGPRCTSCLSCGSFCDSVSFPLQCEQCCARHGAHSCNLAFSDELNNDLATDLKLWVEMSSGNWRDQMRELEASSLQVEMADRARPLSLNHHHYNILRLLHAIVCAHRSITRQEFVSRFAGDSPEMQDFNAEYFLRLAMLQGIRADVEVTCEWSWHFYQPMDLMKPIPMFGSAYDFYDALEDAMNPQRPLGFYMIPANPEADIPPVWVPLEVDDFEVTISSGTNGKKVRDRFYQKTFTALGVNIPEHLLLMDDEASGRIPSLEELGHMGSLYSFDVLPIRSYTGKIAEAPPAVPSSSKTATSKVRRAPSPLPESPPAPLESDEPEGGSGSEDEEPSMFESPPADQQDDTQDFDMADADREGDEDDPDLSTMLGGTGGLAFDDVSLLDAALSGKKPRA